LREQGFRQCFHLGGPLLADHAGGECALVIVAQFIGQYHAAHRQTPLRWVVVF